MKGNHFFVKEEEEDSVSIAEPLEEHTGKDSDSQSDFTRTQTLECAKEASHAAWMH